MIDKHVTEGRPAPDRHMKGPDPDAMTGRRTNQGNRGRPGQQNSDHLQGIGARAPETIWRAMSEYVWEQDMEWFSKVGVAAEMGPGPEREKAFIACAYHFLDKGRDAEPGSIERRVNCVIAHTVLRYMLGELP